MKNGKKDSGIIIALICLGVLLGISLAAIWAAKDNPSLQSSVSLINDAFRFVVHCAVIAGAVWYLAKQIKKRKR